MPIDPTCPLPQTVRTLSLFPVLSASPTAPSSPFFPVLSLSTSLRHKLFRSGKRPRKAWGQTEVCLTTVPPPGKRVSFLLNEPKVSALRDWPRESPSVCLLSRHVEKATGEWFLRSEELAHNRRVKYTFQSEEWEAVKETDMDRDVSLLFRFSISISVAVGFLVGVLLRALPLVQ